MENHFFIRQLKIDQYQQSSPENTILITQSSNPLYGTGAKSWDSSICLAKTLAYFHQQKIQNFTNKIIVELGCGVGLISIYLAALGGMVYATDLPNIKQLVEKNMQNNINVTKNRVKFFTYNWNQQWQIQNKIDYIVASQPFVNNPELYESFINCICKLVNKNSSCKLFLAFKLRENELSIFENKLEDIGLSGQRLSKDDMHPDFIDERVVIYCIRK